jgi:hypothetical protein
VDVGQDGDAVLRLDAGEDLEPTLQAQAAVRLDARAVGLVVARLEDERDAELARDVLEPRRHLAGMARVLDDTRPRDEEQLSVAELRSSDRDCRRHR